MRLTPLGFRVIIVMPLAIAAGLLLTIIQMLPLFNGASLLLTFAIIALVALAIHNYGWYRATHPRYTARHGGGVSVQGAYHVARHGES